MKLDALIEQLTEDLSPVRPRRVWVDALIIALIAASELALLFAVGIAHLDMHRVMSQPTVGWRIVSLGLISLVSGWLAIRSFDPAYSARGSMRWLALIIVLCVAYGVLASALPAGAASIVQRLDWHSGVQCASKIVLLSIPPLLALAVLGHRGAPTDLRRTPLLIGLAAAAWGAFVFVFACPFNDPLYILAWYGLACGIVTLVARLVLPRFAHW
ncbi:MAG: NrsF family protein [Steroidobacteraceae bacterium]